MPRASRRNKRPAAVPRFSPPRAAGLFRASAADPAPPAPRSYVWSYVGSYLWSVAGVALTTGLLFLLRRFLDEPGDASLLYLPLVIACAVRSGFGPAALAAVLSVLCWDFFFLAPRFTLQVTQGRDWAALLVFLAAAVVTARLGARARAQAKLAEAREREIATLYAVGRTVSSEADADRLLPTLAEQVVAVCLASRCVVLDLPPGGEGTLPLPRIVAAAAPPGGPPPAAERRIREDAAAASAHHALIGRGVDWPSPLAAPEWFGLPPAAGADDPAAGVYVPLRVEERAVGVLHVGPRRDGRPYSAREERLVLALANLAAVVIARQGVADQARQQTRQAAILDERNRLAREIHDTIAQGLTGIVIQLQAADALAGGEKAGAIAAARALAEECLGEARRSVKALRPGPLEGCGLADALERTVARMTRGGVPPVRARFDLRGAPGALPADAEADLLRVAQEALTNALRHAWASEVTVTLAYAPGGGVRLSVRDNGRGFDPARPEDRAEGGFGLTSMRERAARIGAEFSLVSAPGRGTRVEVTLPAAGAAPAATAPAVAAAPPVAASHFSAAASGGREGATPR